MSEKANEDVAQVSECIYKKINPAIEEVVFAEWPNYGAGWPVVFRRRKSQGRGE